jgi:hypothetical protein
MDVHIGATAVTKFIQLSAESKRQDPPADFMFLILGIEEKVCKKDVLRATRLYVPPQTRTPSSGVYAKCYDTKEDWHGATEEAGWRNWRICPPTHRKHPSPTRASTTATNPPTATHLPPLPSSSLHFVCTPHFLAPAQRRRHQRRTKVSTITDRCVFGVSGFASAFSTPHSPRPIPVST